MPQRRAAKKDLRQSKKRRQRNLIIKHRIKTAVKKLKTSLKENDSKTRGKAFQRVCKLLDKAVAKNVIHKNKAANRKSRFAKLIKPSQKAASVKKK